MRASRRLSSWLSGWLILALLFMQGLASAHACRVDSPAAPGSPAHAEAMGGMAHMPGCPGAADDSHVADGPAAEGALLCQVHCQQGSQTVHPTPAVDAPATPVLLAVLDWAPASLAPMGTRCASPDLRSGAPPPGAPPLYLSLLVLRN